MATSGPAHRVTSAVEVYGYPQGHLGHLTAEEDRQLTDFKRIVQEKGLYTPGRNGMGASHDDATLLRFLRARRFQAVDGLKQFADTEAWRKANELDKVYETIDVEQYDETRKLYPQWTGRRDRRGIPVYIYEVKHLNSKTMSAYEKSAAHTSTKAKTDGKTPAKLIRLFALYENLIRFVMPLSTMLTDREYSGTPITQSNNIVDISGVGLKQFWNLRGHMQDASQLATAHYPETLDRIFVIGAPSFFPTVWGWIKKWFDPITTSKIFILSSSDLLPTLESFIDPANIPIKYGGKLDYKFGGPACLDPALGEVLTWSGNHKSFPSGPMYWEPIQGAQGELQGMRAIAAGSVGGIDRREEVCVVQTGSAIRTHKAFLSAETVTNRPDLMRAPTADEYVTRNPSHEPEPVGTPESEGSPVDTPRMGSTMATPQVGSTMATPQVGSAMATPHVGSMMNTPQMGSTMTTPQMESTMTTPQMGSTMTTPHVGSTIDTPQMGSGFVPHDRRASIGSPAMAIAGDSSMHMNQNVATMTSPAAVISGGADGGALPKRPELETFVTASEGVERLNLGGEGGVR